MTVPLRAALYLRVSTARQAEHDVSIPDQRKQGEAYCAARGYQLVETYVEPGASATNDRRPEFQRMIEAGTSKPAPFDMVIVHSFSRFFRDACDMEFYVRRLAKNGVKLLSITQEIGDDPIHQMMRQIMALFDEYQSKENAKHVLRAQKENARQGFWNGALPPIGYRIVASETRGAKVKKKLEIDPLHADTVRLIYRLALDGDGNSGPMGVKAIVSHLNRNRIFTRDGGRWGDRPASPHPDPQDLYRPTRVQQTLQGQRIETGEQGRHSRGAAADRPGDVRRSAGPSQGAESEGGATPCRHRPDAAHRYLLLWSLRWSHDHPHRQGRALPLLCLLDQSPAGRDRLRGPGDPDGQAGQPWSPATSRTVCWRPSGWRKCWPPSWTAGRIMPSGGASISPS